MSNIFTVSLFADNQQLVLQRIILICGRKKLYIESLSVTDVEDNTQAHYTLRVRAERVALEKTIKQLERIVEVHAVSIVSTGGIEIEQIAQAVEKINDAGEYLRSLALEQRA